MPILKKYLVKYGNVNFYDQKSSISSLINQNSSRFTSTPLMHSEFSSRPFIVLMLFQSRRIMRMKSRPFSSAKCPMCGQCSWIRFSTTSKRRKLERETKKVQNIFCLSISFPPKFFLCKCLFRFPFKGYFLFSL